MSNQGRSALLGFAVSVFGIVIAMILPVDALYLPKRMLKLLPANPLSPAAAR